MGNTPKLSMPQLAANQSQKYVTMNGDIRILDALVQMNVKNQTTAAPPGSPSDGDTYVVAASPSGAWVGEHNSIAYYNVNAWAFFVPLEGWLTYDESTHTFYYYNGSAWTALGSNLVFSSLGVNTSADSTNKLAVDSAAILFNNIGNGVQVKINKNAATDTASLLYQTGFSGRAETGLTGDDNFHWKVSPDGSTWYESFHIDRYNGNIQAEHNVREQFPITPFTPLTISGLRGWWDGNDYSNISFSSTTVNHWYDKSGYHNDGNQTGSTRPVWSTTQFCSIAPGMDFSSGTDFKVTDATSIQNIFNGGGVIMGSLNVSGSAGNGMIVTKSTDGVTTSGYTLHHYGTGSYHLRLTVGASTTGGNYDWGPYNFNEPYVFELYYNTSSPGTNPVLYMNGVKQTVSVSSTTTGTVATDAGADLIVGNITDGGSSPMIGQLGQLAFFTGTPSATNIAMLRSYFGYLSGIPTVPIYALCGQSNMVGNAACQQASINVPIANNLKGIRPLIWDGNRFAPFVVGSNNYGITADAFGPETSFAQAMPGLLHSSPYIIKYALGATDLATNWAPTSGAQWIAMKAAFDAAIPLLSNSGKIPLVMAFGWAQGETDGQNSTNATNYGTNLTAFISAVKGTALAPYSLSPDFTFVIVGIGPVTTVAAPTGVPYAGTIRTAQISVGANTGNAYIDTTDLTLNVDNIHFDAPAAVKVGQRLADKVNLGFASFMRQLYTA